MRSLMRSQTLLEARWILLILASVGVAVWFVSMWLSLIFLALFFFTIAFFRDPNRPVPAGPNLGVAPAGGRVRDLVGLDKKDIFKRKTLCCWIFLSIFGVPTNRAPIDGRIVYRQHHAGLCLDARDPNCSEKNEAMTWGFENPRGLIVVRQLTGAIARRIVAWANVGDELKKGERLGMIRFGSRTELYLPLDAEVLVKRGDHVFGGSTVIARLLDR